MTVGIVIVAAGLGTRFRQQSGNPRANKLMAGCSVVGELVLPVFTHSLRHALQALDNVIVVTRPDYYEIQRQSERSGCRCICLDSSGLSDSIAAGVQNTPDWQGWLVALADMPFIQPKTFTTVANSLAAHVIARPIYQQQAGHPVGFGADFRAELMALQGDNGARSLFQRCAPRMIPVNDAGVLRDIDKPDDLIDPIFSPDG